MKKVKKIFILVLIIYFLLTFNSLATDENVITFNDVTTTMPEVVSEEYYKEVILKENSDSNFDDSFFVQKSGARIESTLRAKPEETISQLISRFSNDTTVVGIDVSSHQAEIDWAKVAESGVKFAMLRCGFRGYGNAGTLVKDTCFDRNIQEALNNGIYVGVYFYSTALNEQEALQEAELTYECIKNYNLKYPVAYDFEEFGVHRTENLSNEQMHKNAKLFLDYIKSKGYTVSLYGSASPLKDTWNMNEMKAYDTWVAHYYVSQPSYYGSYQLWQYTDNATVPGISTKVDVDVDYAYFAGMKAANALNPYIKNTGWNKIDDDWCYLTNDGILAIGWKFINEKWYYFDPNNGIMLKDCIRKIGNDIYSFDDQGEIMLGPCWYYKDDNWYYITSTGKFLTGWILHNDIWYYLSPDDGKMMTDGPIFDGNAVYWLDESGAWIKPEDGWYEVIVNDKTVLYYFKDGIGFTNWHIIDDCWYYFDKGIMSIGWKFINGKWYYFNEDGKMFSDVCITLGENIYFFEESGAMISNNWFKYQGIWYYLKNNGSVTKGWGFINGKWYYFDNEGKMFSNICMKINDDIYCFEESGAMISNNWFKYQENWYYLNSNGSASKGWKLINNIWYYFDNLSCKMHFNAILTINGKIYCFDKTGAMVTNRWIKTSDMKWYCFGNSGVSEEKSGWQKIDDVWYYLENNNSIAVGWRKINNVWYYLDEEGKDVYNTRKLINGCYYWFDASGAMLSNCWKYEDSSWYYMEESGALAIGWKLINGKWYYFYEDCKMFNGKELVLGNKIHTFDSSGAWISERDI